MRGLLLSLMVLVWPLAALQAQTSSAWDAVGRLDIDGKGFCTGTLIAPDLVLTAAHCMFDRESELAVPPSRILFRAGLSTETAVATRNVRRAVIHPAYDPALAPSRQKVRHDVAVLQLSDPISTDLVVPVDISASVDRRAGIAVVSYALGREDAPKDNSCRIITQQEGVLVMDCDVTFGASGSPVFQINDNGLRLVSVVSAMAMFDGETVALGMDLVEPITLLSLAMATTDDAPEQP